jgi:hypothetical protein
MDRECPLCCASRTQCGHSARSKKGAAFGPNDHLVGMRGECRASSVSAGRAGGIPRRQLPVACAIIVQNATIAVRGIVRAHAAAFAVPRKLELPMMLPIRILQLCPVALESKCSMILRDKNSPGDRVCLRVCLEFNF